ncbi:intracellular protein transport protein USO1 isoform X2 [Drosophila mauritiana]|uniref:Intracellular protein transport protein USO1 isoform X2 n=1 Tax=Drosophila mauritiana TaxID=7226 RepID=A0A6P8KEG5_DROMA|nr:intracellular protein transport protein USO1 isoform X2 [Drosophila mauritiana]
MAENQTKTTSSKGCNTMSRTAHILAPHNGTVVRRTDPGSKLKESFHMEKRDIEDWQTMAKSKLKRKKKLSSSLTSVGDTVNQEKRTRIEGIQLHCRGKLRPKDTQSFEAEKRPPAGSQKQMGKTEKDRERPVIIGGVTTTNVIAAPPQRIKRKLQENMDTIQKLNALTEQLRLEVNELKSSLITERGAVRALRAQNDADSRRWKSEVKKLQHTLEMAKKSNGMKKAIESGPESSGAHVTADGLINYEIQRLTNEIAVLKEANRNKEEKTQIMGQADRLKAADMRQLKNAYENRLTHIQKSAKIEITRLITQLKNIELINNTKNAHKSALEMRTTMKSSQPNGLDDAPTRMRAPDEMRATTWMTTLLGSHSHSHSHSHPAVAKSKDPNSDTDSALSSAPPSISPQPPSSGSDSGVIWQTLQDLDKLQKEAEMYQKENERLQTEVQLMKQELDAAEKAAMSSGKKQAQIGELMQRIKELEEKQSSLEDEASELREQNELLEFRILELEDDSDKMESTCEGHCQSLQELLEQSAQQLEDRDKRCLQQLLQCVQQLDLDAIMPGDQNRTETPRRHNPTHSHSHSQSHNHRIVATVQPYSNCATPTAPPTPSKRHCSQVSSWQSSSLSESGVFVECDLPSNPNPIGHPHLLFYQERLEQLEGKLLIYESSGETQARHLAQRLQRELQLEKDLKELADRVELLIEQNAQLEEAKCEFEEAENDTRLHLQRNEVELEILRQRNVELEFGKEALGAKYQDCRAEVLILREDLAAAETQLEHLQAERKQARKELQDLRRSLPLLLISRFLSLAKMGNEESSMGGSPRLSSGYTSSIHQDRDFSAKIQTTEFDLGQAGFTDSGEHREIVYLKEEVKSLRSQLKELNARHYEAMETADSHWVDLEQQYKEREEAQQAKEASLKQKIAQLQDCLREDSRAATEKIQQLEEGELSLKSCLVRMTKEHRDLLTENRTLQCSLESLMAKMEKEAEHKMPLTEALENERRRTQTLMDDLIFAKKVQQNTEDQLRQETDALRTQIFNIKKDYLHIEVTNGELKEEVGTLENKIRQMENQMRDSEERARCLEDELRTKDEQCQLLERKLGVMPEGYSLADELHDSPAKRAKKDEVPSLQAASQGLGVALLDLEGRDFGLPLQKDFQAIACSVKQLADTLLSQSPSEVSLQSKEPAKPAGSEPEGSSWATVQDASSEKIPETGLSTVTSLECQGNQETQDYQVIQENPGSLESQVDSECLESQERNLVSSKKSSYVSVLTSSCRSIVRELAGGSAQKSELHLGESDSRADPQIIQPTDEEEQKVTALPSSMRQLFHEVCSVDHKPEHEPEIKKKSKKRAKDKKERHPRPNSRQRKIQRFLFRHIYHPRTRDRTLGFPLEKSLSCSSFYSLLSVHSVHSARSGISMHSLHAEVVNRDLGSLTSVSFVQTDELKTLEGEVQVTAESNEQEIQVHPETVECGTQIDVGVEQRLLLMPLRTRCFVDLLQGAVDGYLDVAAFRTRLLRLWEGGEDFREHLEFLQDMWIEKSTQKSQESYEGFVAALDCVHNLKLALKPASSALLQQIERRIHTRLLLFHNHKAESEFCCTVYIPVERSNSTLFRANK